MTTKPHRYFWIVFVILLVACGTISPEQTGSAASTSAPSLTQAVSPTETAVPTPLPKFPLDQLRMAYIVDGNLYVQDGDNPPVQLTYSGEDFDPEFSDDGKRIVFYRGEDDKNLVIFDMDEIEEKALVTPSHMVELGIVGQQKAVGYYFDALSFVPNAYSLLVHYSLYDLEDNKAFSGGNSVGLILVDTDSGGIRKFLSQGLGDDFAISPDGRMLSVATRGRMDIFNMDGLVYQKNVLNYAAVEYTPRQFWLPDSKEIIYALPVERRFDITETTPTYGIWRYLLDSKKTTQVTLNPPPTLPGGCGFRVSPNGAWILYVTPAADLYVGNLNTGIVQLYAHSACPKSAWSPDGNGFVYLGGHNDIFLGAIGKPPVLLGSIIFLGWIDNYARFLYYSPSTLHDEKSQIFVGVVVDGEMSAYKTLGAFPKNFYDFTFVVR